MPRKQEAAVAATRYPGTGKNKADGVRGVMSLARMNNYGAQIPHYYHEIADQICNIIQVETVEAIENIEEIAAVEGVDALFIGPSDLSASMGHLGNPAHPEVRDAIEKGFQKIAATGKPGGFLSANPDDCKWVLRMQGLPALRRRQRRSVPHKHVQSKSCRISRLCCSICRMFEIKR